MQTSQGRGRWLALVATSPSSLHHSWNEAPMETRVLAWSKTQTALDTANWAGNSDGGVRRTEKEGLTITRPPLFSTTEKTAWKMKFLDFCFNILHNDDISNKSISIVSRSKKCENIQYSPLQKYWKVNSFASAIHWRQLSLRLKGVHEMINPNCRFYSWEDEPTWAKPDCENISVYTVDLHDIMKVGGIITILQIWIQLLSAP